jgi:hypothetical protein
MSNKLRARPEWINVLKFGLKGTADELISQSKLDKIIALARATGRKIFFPDGTYVFPKTFYNNVGFDYVELIGESKEKTIITTAWSGDTFRIPERIDLSFPKYQPDGFYRVNVTGQIDASWSALGSSIDIDDYIKIVAGVPSVATFAEIKAANYLTELDVTKPDPGIDGKYVVAATNETIGGGGYTHSNLPYNTAIKYIVGTILIRSGGVWSRYAPSLGFQFSGNFKVSNIQFYDCAFYLFTPYNITKPDQDFYEIDNCIFKHVIRVNALDRQYQASAIQSQGFVKGAAYHFQDGESFCYKNIKFTNNECSYIHTCIFWEIPPTRNLVVTGNIIRDCYTFTELFIYLPMGSSTTDDSEDAEGYTNKTNSYFDNNLFENCCHYSPVSHGGHHIMRGNGKASFRNNRIINCTGSIFYLSGNGNSVDNNTIVPYIQLYPEKEGVGLVWSIPTMFHIKTGNSNNVGATTITNNAVEKSALYRIVDIKNTNTFININSNKLMNAGYAEQIVSSDVEAMNRELMYYINDLTRFKELTGITTVDDWVAGVYVSGKLVEDGATMYQCVRKTTIDDLSPSADISTNGLAGAKWRSIEVGRFVYFDIRRRTWMYFPASVARDAGFIDKNYAGDSVYPISVSNNVIYAYNLSTLYDGNIHDITYDNNDIFIDRDLIGQSIGSEGYGAHIKFLKLYNNRIYRNGLASSSSFFNNLNNILAVNNDFFYAMGTFNIRFRNQIDWINNRVKPWPKFANTSNISSLSLPSANTNAAIVFSRTLPSAWSAGTYATGTFRSYNYQAYESIADVVPEDGSPDVATTKWKLVDDPILNIQGGSFDSYMARTAALSWSNVNRVIIEGSLFVVRLINDWANVYRTVAAGGSSNRFAIMQTTTNAAPTRDLMLSNIKFDFEDRANRHIFYTAGANAITVSNLVIKDIPEYGSFPLNKVLYKVSGATVSFTKAVINGADVALTDSGFQSAITNKVYNQSAGYLNVLNSMKLDFLAGGGNRSVLTDNAGNIYAGYVSGGGTSSGGVGDPGSSGIMIRTEPGSTIARSVQGTTNRIGVTNPDGISGNIILNVGSDIIDKTSAQTMQDKTLGAGTKIDLGTTEAADMYYTDANGNLVRVPRGNVGEIWGVVSATTLGWIAAISGGGGTSSGGGTDIYFDGNDFAGTGAYGDPWRLAVGSPLLDPNANGFMVRIGDNTLINREIFGTNGLIVVSNGSGVNGQPTITVGSYVNRNDVSGNNITALKTHTQDIVINDTTKGIVERSPDGTYWRLKVDNLGNWYSENTGA